MSQDYESMYTRCRRAAGMTQEHAAELLGVAVRTLAAWERGESTPPNARVLSMVDIYGTPSLAIEHLRTTSEIAYSLLPEVRSIPLAQAVCRLISAIKHLETIHAGDRLLEIAADGEVDELEMDDYTQLLRDLEPVVGAVLALRCAREEGEVNG